MWDRRISRRRVLGLSGVAIASAMLGRRVTAQSEFEALRIGFVLPQSTGAEPLRADHDQLAATVARMGAELAEADFGLEAEMAGRHLEVLFSNAPDGEAALRAAERMTTLEDVVAVAGGYGADQFEALAGVAEERGVLFLNIGMSTGRFRQAACNSYTFHVEGTDAMYLEALASWYRNHDFQRPFFVHGEGEEGKVLLERARLAFGEQVPNLAEAGSFGVSDSPAYIEAINAVRASPADLVVLLLDWRAQLDFMGFYDAFSLEPRLAGFPFPVTQTRIFYRAVGEAMSPPAQVTRTALWEATLEGNGSAELNNRFLGRFGRPMDGPAWAGYAAVGIAMQAALAADSPADLPLWLESEEASFDLHKGEPLSFRPADHQLIQPLYLVEIDRRAETELAAASLLETFEAEAFKGEPLETRVRRC